MCNTRALKREWTVRVDVRSRDISYTEPTEGERVVKCRCGWARAPSNFWPLLSLVLDLHVGIVRSKDGGGWAGDGMAIKCGSRAGTNFSSDICRNSCITPSHCRALDQPGKRSHRQRMSVVGTCAFAEISRLRCLFLDLDRLAGMTGHVIFKRGYKRCALGQGHAPD